MVDNWHDATATLVLGIAFVAAIVGLFVALRIVAYILAGWRRRRMERAAWRAHVDRMGGR
jgi:biopolymer transport protein ExbB/TolQ